MPEVCWLIGTLSQLAAGLYHPARHRGFRGAAAPRPGAADASPGAPPVVRLSYHWFSTALGRLCIAKSTQGVSLLTWETQATQLLSTLRRQASVEVHEDEAALQALRIELQAYLAGTCKRLPWSIDERCMRSSFQREVLKLTAAIPYGAVMSYQGLAAALGQPKAVRAVAQALGHNPRKQM